MAFDPLQEDCLRLVLASMERDGIYPLEDAAYVQQASDAFQKDPAALIHTDRDRSFHLLTKATELIDYRMPFATSEDDVDKLLERAEGYLREALELDPTSWDAKRMLAILQSESDDELVAYLMDQREAVAADAARLLNEAKSPYELEYAQDLGQHPYLRWLGTLASRLLIAGQYRLAYQTAEDCLAIAPLDLGGARHTGMLALAKLEATSDDLVRYRARHALAYQLESAAATTMRRHAQRRGAAHGAAQATAAQTQQLDAWSLIAELSLAYRAFDYKRADSVLATILKRYAHAAQTLYFQAEFPDGVFARVNVLPGSEDELVLALSEATPLLQEGAGTPEMASFAQWIADHELVQREISAQDVQLRMQMDGPYDGPLGGSFGGISRGPADGPFGGPRLGGDN